LKILIKEYQEKLIIGQDLAKKLIEYLDFERDLPLYVDDTSEEEKSELAHKTFLLQDELMSILKTIRDLEYLIITYYNYNHEKLAEEDLDEY